MAIGSEYTYRCSAVCAPSCDFTWRFMGKTFEGDRLDLTISDYSKIEPLTCEAKNTLSNTTITATINLTVTGESTTLLQLIYFSGLCNVSQFCHTLGKGFSGSNP